MIPGTRFYYDRHGRYRGKASPLGPISVAFWSLVLVAIAGTVFWEFLAEAWWFFALIVAGTCVFIGFGRGVLGLILGKSTPGSWLLFIFSLAIGAFIVLIHVGQQIDTQRVQSHVQHQSASSND